jgi:hypothetical protein
MDQKKALRRPGWSRVKSTPWKGLATWNSSWTRRCQALPAQATLKFEQVKEKCETIVGSSQEV